MGEFARGGDHFLDRSLDISNILLPEGVETVDGMISVRERRLLFGLARDVYAGEGAIIDGGAFLGASGVALAEGVRANRAAGQGAWMTSGRKPITSYELGVFPSTGISGREVVCGRTVIRTGESFAPLLIRNLKPYRDLVDVIVGDAMEQTWPKADPIEVLFIDVAKTPDLNQHVFRQFFPALIPGRSFVVHQDFFFDRLPWIKVMMGYLADHFEWLGQIGPSSIYRYVKPIPESLYAVDPYRELSTPERVHLHRATHDPRLSTRRRFALELSLAYLLFEVSGPEAAGAHLDQTAEAYVDYTRDARLGPSALMRLARARRSMGLPVKPSDAPELEREASESLRRLRGSLQSLIASTQAALTDLDAALKVATERDHPAVESAEL